MNLIKLFETQKVLDEKILKEKGLEGQDLLPMKILALQVELGELANEWRGFKFWSEDREPRTRVPVTAWGEPYKNPLLEEYVDILHFILSIGLEKNFTKPDIFDFAGAQKEITITDSFLSSFEAVASMDLHKSFDEYSYLFSRFIELGQMLGFTWDQVEQAYYTKNEINHERQATGY